MDAILEAISRGVEQLLGRASGPLHLRLVIMPTVVTILAIRAGLKDARERQPPFLWGILAFPAERRTRLLSACNDLTRIFIVACLLDSVYQLVFLRAFSVVQLLIVAVGCAILPYVLFRGPTSRLARLFSGKQPGQSEEVAANTKTKVEDRPDNQNHVEG